MSLASPLAMLPDPSQHAAPNDDRQKSAPQPEKLEKDKPAFPVRRGTSDDPSSAREIENPGDPGPPVLVPPDPSDPLESIPGDDKPTPGV